MTKCRCAHNVPWFWMCLDCLQERAASDCRIDTWDGFKAPKVRDDEWYPGTHPTMQYLSCRILA